MKSLAVEIYKHIKVPGFGCTYGHEFEARTEHGVFLLKHLIKDESLAVDGCELMLIFPLEAGSATVEKGKIQHDVDFHGFFTASGTAGGRLTSQSPFLKVAVLGFSESVLATAASVFALDQGKMRRLFTKTAVLPRTVWINELCHRYIFERSVARQPDSLAARFLEAELVKEAYYGQLTASKQPGTTARAGTPEPYFAMLPKALQAALTYIEEHLFDDITLDGLARTCAVSAPTLIRLFRKHTGAAPMRHLQQRRLTEAKILLATGRHTVSAVAEIAGYADISSFSHAYRKVNGTPPSSDMLSPGGSHRKKPRR